MSSSTTTPLWGPQKPRIDRIRERLWFTQKQYLGSQSRNGITLVEAPWIYTSVRDIWSNVEFCQDTVRNPKFEPFRPKEFFDDGGPLLIRKSRWEFSDAGRGIVTPWVGNARVKYGLVTIMSAFLDGGFNIYSRYPPDSDANFASWHAKAYSRLRPDMPLLDLATFVLELRDLVKLNFKAIRDIKSLSDWWLATNFGWKPLLADIMRMYTLYNSLDSRLAWIIANEAVPVRRRVKLHHESSPNVTIHNANGIGINRNTFIDWPGRASLNSSWRYKITRSLSQEVWASGSFIYYIKDLKLPAKRKFVEMALIGLQPSPAQIWNAIPWTWLIDWLTNIGDILQNISKQVSDRLVAQYFYVMGKTTRTYDWFGTDGYYSCSMRHIYESKKREVGHPYGLSFGSNLTAMQLSILAALGAQKF